MVINNGLEVTPTTDASQSDWCIKNVTRQNLTVYNPLNGQSFASDGTRPSYLMYMQ